MGNGFYGHDKYWNEHLDIPLGYVADYIRRLDEGQSIMRPTQELIVEKDRIVEEYRELLDWRYDLGQCDYEAGEGARGSSLPISRWSSRSDGRGCAGTTPPRRRSSPL